MQFSTLIINLEQTVINKQYFKRQRFANNAL